MKLIDTDFEGLFIVENQRIDDQRGFFEKKFNQELLSRITKNVGESYVSRSSKGVLRGLHFQRGLAAQTKLVTCISGSFIDIAVDLRKEKETFGRVFLYKVDSREPISLFIPGEFAHGIFALEDNTVLLNYAGSVYSPGNEGGILWSSVTELDFIKNPIISEKDSALPSLKIILESYEQ